MNENSNDGNSRSYKKFYIYSDPSKNIEKLENKQCRVDEIRKEIVVELNKKFQLKQVKEIDRINMIDKSTKYKAKRKNSLQKNAHLKKPKRFKHKNSWYTSGDNNIQIRSMVDNTSPTK